MKDKKQNLNLAVIGNCAINSLIDEHASIVFGCWSQADGDPLFSSLLQDDTTHNDSVASFDIKLKKQASIEQNYIDNTAILRTILTDTDGNKAELIDFAPRISDGKDCLAPRAIVRIIRPLVGTPSFESRCNPRFNYNADTPTTQVTENGIQYTGAGISVRLVTNTSVLDIHESQEILLDQPYALLFGMDLEQITDPLAQAKQWLTATTEHWQNWILSLTLPTSYTGAVIRSAIGLKMCWHQETGAILAALTMGLPAENANNRCWDYRFCWIRDSFYTAEALHKLGDKEVIQGYKTFLRPLLEKVSESDIQCMYGLNGNENLTELTVPSLSGYRGLGPVLKGNKASEQTQLDCFGHVLNIFALVTLDEKQCTDDELSLMLQTAEQAYQNYQKPDAGFWELRGVERVHTYSAIISWRAMDFMERVLICLGDQDLANLWHNRKNECKDTILREAWSEDEQAFAGFFGGDALDVTILHMVDIGMIDANDERLKHTIEAMNRRLRKENYLLPYDEEDDFGVRECGFNLCTFWFINSLHHIGHHTEAQTMYESMLSHRNQFGFLSEVIDPKTNEQWGNYPQAYSLMCIIQTAHILSDGRHKKITSID